jgi:preprotein translocase subunit YajC
MGPIISLALMLILFWVLLVLPQRRRLQAQRALVSSIEVGDEVMTTAGLYGTIDEIDGDVVHLRLADGVVVRSARWAVAQRITVPEPELDDPEFDDEEHDADLFTGDVADLTDGADGDADAGADADVDER